MRPYVSDLLYKTLKNILYNSNIRNWYFYGALWSNRPRELPGSRGPFHFTGPPCGLTTRILEVFEAKEEKIPPPFNPPIYHTLPFIFGYL